MLGVGSSVWNFKQDARKSNQDLEQIEEKG